MAISGIHPAYQRPVRQRRSLDHILHLGASRHKHLCNRHGAVVSTCMHHGAVVSTCMHLSSRAAVGRLLSSQLLEERAG